MAENHRVEVALPLPVPTTFTYAVEGAPPPPGIRVLVPFRRQERIGWVVGPGSGASPPRLRTVLDVLEDEPSAPPEILDLALWMASYYLTPLGIVLRTCLPSVLSDSSRDFLSPGVSLAEGRDLEACTPRERRILLAVGAGSGPQRVSTLRKAMGMGSLWPEIRRLKGKGLIRHEILPPRPPPVRTQRIVRLEKWISDLTARETIFSRAPRQREAYELLESSGGSVELAHLLEAGGYSRSVLKGLEEKGIAVVVDQEVMRDPFRDRAPAEAGAHTPTPDQARVLEALVEATSEPHPKPALIYGVTGSGKTLVYIELLKEVVGRQGQGGHRSGSGDRSHSSDRVPVQSPLRRRRRSSPLGALGWRAFRCVAAAQARGRSESRWGLDRLCSLQCGTLGIIVVDEEHDGSYKQSEGPRYQGRDVAVVRASRRGSLRPGECDAFPGELAERGHPGSSAHHSLPSRVGGGVPSAGEGRGPEETVWRQGAGAKAREVPGRTRPRRAFPRAG